MPICKKCNRDLPREEFYPSLLKHYNYVCKDCHNKRCKKPKRVLKKKIEDKDIDLIDRPIGGYIISLVRYAKNNEFKYSLYQTRKNNTLYTNDGEVILSWFKKALKEIEDNG